MLQVARKQRWQAEREQEVVRRAAEQADREAKARATKAAAKSVKKSEAAATKAADGDPLSSFLSDLTGAAEVDKVRFLCASQSRLLAQLTAVFCFALYAGPHSE